MLICARCSTAYLVQEGHKCQLSPSLVPAILGLVFGIVLGAAAGAWVAATLVVLSGGFPHAGAVVYFVAPPLGALVGSILGVRAASPTP